MSLIKSNNILLLLVFIIFTFVSAKAQQNNDTVCGVIDNYDKTINDAAYKPNVDVYGNTVSGAELGNGPSKHFLPEIIRIPINIDLVNYVDQDLPEGIQMESNFGMLEIHPDGKVIFNNQDITDSTHSYCEDDKSVVHEAVQIQQRTHHQSSQQTADNYTQSSFSGATNAPANILAEPSLNEPALTEPVLTEPMLSNRNAVSQQRKRGEPIILGNGPEYKDATQGTMQGLNRKEGSEIISGGEN